MPRQWRVRVRIRHQRQNRRRAWQPAVCGGRRGGRARRQPELAPCAALDVKYLGHERTVWGVYAAWDLPSCRDETGNIMWLRMIDKNISSDCLVQCSRDHAACYCLDKKNCCRRPLAGQPPYICTKGKKIIAPAMVTGCQHIEEAGAEQKCHTQCRVIAASTASAADGQRYTTRTSSCGLKAKLMRSRLCIRARTCTARQTNHAVAYLVERGIGSTPWQMSRQGVRAPGAADRPALEGSNAARQRLKRARRVAPGTTERCAHTLDPALQERAGVA